MYSKNESELISLIKSNSSLCDEEAQSEIAHNLGVDEWEKAYEILVIELIKNNQKPKNFDKTLWRQYLVDFGIADDPVIDAELMKKFDDWT